MPDCDKEPIEGWRESENGTAAALRDRCSGAGRRLERPDVGRGGIARGGEEDWSAETRLAWPSKERDSLILDVDFGVGWDVAWLKSNGGHGSSGST